MTELQEVSREIPNKFNCTASQKRIITGGSEKSEKAYGCTQAELSARSGVSLRSIQMYEQRNKDINKAGADTIYRLAKVMGCTMEDLIERG